MEITSDYRALGIRFTDTGLYPLLQIPVSELTDQVVKLDDIWANRFSSLRDRLMKIPGIESKFLLVEKYLFQLLQTAEVPHPATTFTANLLKNASMNYTVEDAANRLNISHKHLIRLFNRHVGLPPKRFQRIFRFQQVLKLMSHPDVDSSHILEIAGYYDQSHFNREFKQFTGMTPREYRALAKADLHSVLLD